MRDDFVYKGIHFKEYIGNTTDINGTVFPFIPADEAIFFPMGTTNTFEVVFAPANYVETVNTRGLPVYAKQERMKFDKGIEIETQSNPLPICKRPEVLVRGFSSN